MLTKTNQRLHSLLSEAGLMEQKADLVYSFTNQRTSSSREMTEDEAVDLIGYLRDNLEKIKPTIRYVMPPKNLTPAPLHNERGEVEKRAKEEQKQRTRRYIISIWYRMENANTKDECQEALKKCLAWVEKCFKAHLNSFEMQDLVKIKMAAENALKDRAKAVKNAVQNA